MLLLEVLAGTASQVLSCCPGRVAGSHMLLAVQALEPDAGHSAILGERYWLQVRPEPCAGPLGVVLLSHQLVIQLPKCLFLPRARSRVWGTPGGVGNLHSQQRQGCWCYQSWGLGPSLWNERPGCSCQCYGQVHR